MAYKPVDSIEVQCWGKKVGVIAPDPQRRAYAFEYYPEWQELGVELSPFQSPSRISGAQYFTNLAGNTFLGLPPFIADSLPDRFGNAMIDAFMENEGLRKSEITPLDRLAYMGKRAMGALEFQLMIDTDDMNPSAIAMAELVEAARTALEGDLSGQSENPSEALERLISVGSSAGGARSKAVVGWNPTTKHFVSGQFDVPNGYEHWIIKFSLDSVTGQAGEFGKVEYAYSLMANDCGIRMTDCRLQDVGGGKHFMTKRFDRIGEDKIHMQTLCAMDALDFSMPHTHSYVQLFDVASRLDLGYEAIDELFTRMAFNICMENNDDHPKNFSFVLHEGGRWKLAPAYDLTFSHDSANSWLNEHEMSVNGKFSNITKDDLVKLGRRYNVADPENRIDHIRSIADSWVQYAERAELSIAETDHIGRFIKQRSEDLG